MTDLSIVFSFRNEEDVIEIAVNRIRDLLDQSGISFELIFVDDASTDRSAEILVRLNEQDPRVKVVGMSRCFGLWECVIAGLRHSSGEYVAYMDVDLQDPPEMLPGMLAKARAENAHVVHTLRTVRHGESRRNLIAKRIGYLILNETAEVPMPIEAGDFKLLSRRVVEEIARIEDVDPFMRGIVPWVGFKQVSIPYERQARVAGAGHFTFLNRRTLGHFINAVTGYSIYPLYAVFGIAVGSSALAGTAFLLTLLAWLVGLASGVGVAIAGGILLWAILMACVGVISVYLARVSRECQRRPRYIVAETRGFKNNAQLEGAK